MNLPDELQERLKEEGGPTAAASLVESALTRVIDGTPSDRFAMMQAALPLLEGPSSEFELPEVDQDLLERFREFCQSKSLRGEVLLTGALMSELEMVGASEAEQDSETFAEHCLHPKAEERGELGEEVSRRGKPSRRED